MVLESQLLYKIVNLWFQLVIINNKLAILWRGWLCEIMNTFCETNIRDVVQDNGPGNNRNHSPEPVLMWGRASQVHPLPSSHIMYELNGFRKSTPPQNRQLIVLTSDSKQWVNDFAGDWLSETI